MTFILNIKKKENVAAADTNKGFQFHLLCREAVGLKPHTMVGLCFHSSPAVIIIVDTLLLKAVSRTSCDEIWVFQL